MERNPQDAGLEEAEEDNLAEGFQGVEEDEEGGEEEWEMDEEELVKEEVERDLEEGSEGGKAKSQVVRTEDQVSAQAREVDGEKVVQVLLLLHRWVVHTVEDMEPVQGRR